MLPITSASADAYTAVDAADAALIRPADPQALQALRLLAAREGLRIRRGRITLAGVSRPAWLATRGRELLCAAVLIGEENSANRGDSKDSREG